MKDSERDYAQLGEPDMYPSFMRPIINRSPRRRRSR